MFQAQTSLNHLQAQISSTKHTSSSYPQTQIQAVKASATNSQRYSVRAMLTIDPRIQQLRKQSADLQEMQRSQASRLQPDKPIPAKTSDTSANEEVSLSRTSPVNTRSNHTRMSIVEVSSGVYRQPRARDPTHGIGVSYPGRSATDDQRIVAAKGGDSKYMAQ